MPSPSISIPAHELNILSKMLDFPIWLLYICSKLLFSVCAAHQPSTLALFHKFPVSRLNFRPLSPHFSAPFQIPYFQSSIKIKAISFRPKQIIFLPLTASSRCRPVSLSACQPVSYRSSFLVHRFLDLTVSSRISTFIAIA